MLKKFFKYLVADFKRMLSDERGFTVTTALVTGALVGGGLSAGSGMYQAHQAGKAAKSQQQAWKEMSEPQKEYMRQMYPLQLKQMKAYLPYYEEQVAMERELLPYQREMVETYMPAYKKMFEGVEEYAAGEVQPWERRAVGVPYTEARTRLGERAAGAGTMRAGATQKLATLYDIAEAEALTQLPYRRKQQALEYRLRSLGYQPSAAAISTPGQIGVSIPSMPAQQQTQGQGINWGQIGQMIGMGLNIGGATPATSTALTSTTSGQYGLLNQASQVPFMMMQQ